MKKQFVVLGIIFLFAISFVAAQQEGQIRDGTPEPMLMQAGEGEPMQAGEPTLYGGPQARLQGEGQLMLESGKTVRFSGEGERLRLQTGEHSANCTGCNLTQEQNRIHAMMSNGRKAEIKVMPDQASQRAIERLQLKNCPAETCQIELKEVGQGNDTTMAYNVQTRARAKFLGIFPANVNAEVQIDAETGEVIKTKKPWWAKIVPQEEAEEAE